MQHARILVAATVIIVTLNGCSEDAREASADAVPSPPASAIPDRREQAYAAPDDAGAGMQRLMEAYDAAPKIATPSFEERVAEWAVWAEEYLPRMTERERVHAAYYLTIRDLQREAGPAGNSDLRGYQQMLRVVEIWRHDADGDGRLNEAELEASGRAGYYPGLPYYSLRYSGNDIIREAPIGPEDIAVVGPLPEDASWDMLALHDTNRDGRLDEREYRSAYAHWNNETVAADLFWIRRVATHRLDANRNGKLDGVEMEEFADAMNAEAPFGLGFDTAWTRPSIASALKNSNPFRLEIPAVAPAEPTGRPLPTRPPETYGDVDGDGRRTDIDQFGSQEALDAYRAAHRREYVESTYRGLLTELDTDRSGTLSTEEWEHAYAELPRRHERAVLLTFYDTNTDGRISDPEIADFMRWHDNRGLRADANFDGQVDHRDIITFVEFVKGQ